MKLLVEIVNKSNNALPRYETEGSAGVDLRAYIQSKDIGGDRITIEPGERKLIPTGLYVSIPLGFQWEIRPRSGLAYKQGITVLNTPGTIDSDYRGEVGVILYNSGKFPYQVANGDRIAQAVLMPAIQCNFKPVQVLDETDRGDGGFGSTGNQ